MDDNTGAMNLDRRLLKQARAAGWALGLTVALGTLGGALVVLAGRQLSAVVAGVFLGGEDLAQVTPGLLALLGLAGGRAALAMFGETSAGWAAVRVKNALREMLVDKLAALGPARLANDATGELTATLTQGIEALDAYFSQYLPQAALAGTLPLIVLLAVLPLDWLSGLVLALTAPLIPIFMLLIGKAGEALTRRQFTALSRMSAFFLDTLQGLKTLKELGQSRRQADRIATASEDYRAATMAVLRVTFLSALALELIGTLSTAVIAVQIGLRLLYGLMGFEDAFFILVIAPEFYLPLRQLGLRFHAGMAGVSAAGKIYELLERPTAEVVVRAAAGEVERGLRGDFRLKFEDVHFRYPGREEAALAGVSFELRAGEDLALVGPSGAGKSTIAHLLMRFIEPETGRIMVDGRGIETWGKEEWRAQIAWVPQHPALFRGTVADNLRIANNEAGAEELERALRVAGLWEMVEKLPERLETVIGEQGARLSGGQAQRLALARAFLRDAGLVILDEPTAHLDAAQEALFQTALRELKKTRTVIVIAHRLPTVVDAGRILVMQGGRVVESGRHADLREREGLYTRLARAQEAGA